MTASPSMGTPPRPMTDLHVAAIFERAQRRGQEPFTERMLDDIEANVRAQASGTHRLIAVGRLTEWAESLENAADLMDDEFPSSAGICAANGKEIRSLLAGTPDTKTEPR